MSTAPLVRARGLTLRVQHTTVWQGLDFDLPAGLSVVSGASGSGRSSLLLALVGRMSAITGRLHVDGLDAVGRARAVRQVTSVARISTMIELEPRLTVTEAVTERGLTDGVRTGQAQHRFADLSERLDCRFESATLVGDLNAYRRTLLAAVLAELRPARLAVLDDLDAGLTVTEQRRLLRVLSRLPEPGAGLVVSTREDAAVPSDAALVRLRPEHTTDHATDHREE